MKKEFFPSPMHPEAKHNYTADFTELLAALGDGTDLLTGVPVVTVVGTLPPGLLIAGESLVTGNKKVQWNVDIDTPSHADDTYTSGGVTVCFQVNVSTVAGDNVVQQAELKITDRCE